MMLCSTVAINAKERVVVLEDFSTQKAPGNVWSVADLGEMRIENGALRIDLPQYIPNDPRGWPRATRDMGTVNLAEHNAVRLDVTNPTDREQSLEFGFRDDIGTNGLISELFKPGERRTVTVDFEKTPLTAPLNISRIALMDFMGVQPAHARTWLVHRIELVTDRPEDTYGGRVAAAIDALAKKAQSMQDVKGWSGDVKTRYSKVVAEARQALKEQGDLQEPYVQLLSLRSEMQAIKAEADVKQPLLVWSVPLGTPFRPAEAMGDYSHPLEMLTIVTAGGQYSESLLRLTNLTNATQDVQVTLRGNDGELSSAISFRRNQAVVARDRSVVGDALIPMKNPGIVTLPPRETAEIWVRVNTRNQTLKAGEHVGEIRLMDLRRGLGSAVSVPLRVTVRDFDLRSIGQRMRVQVWGSLFIPRSFVVHGQPNEALENMRDYGVNVFHLYPEEIPWPKLNERGELSVPIDYTKHDEMLALYRGDGNPLILYFMNMDDTAQENWELRSGLPALSDEWEKGARTWIADWSNHLKAKGLSTRDYALYFTDEPGEEELNRYLAFGKIVKEIDPTIQVYLDASHLFHDDEKNAELLRVTDIWQPDELMGYMGNPSLLPYLKAHPDKQLWVYNCRTAMRARRNNAHDYYRLMAWRAMRDGLTGIGYWSYCAAASAQEDPWDETGVSGSGALLVYPGPDKPIASVRWELVRESIDDTRYMQHLRKILDSTQSEEARNAISALCEERFMEVIEKASDPGVVAQWRIDAGAAIEQWGATVN